MNKTVFRYAGMLFILLATALNAFGDDYNGVEFELIVRQKPPLIDNYYEVMRDTLQASLGAQLNSFQVNFSLELNVTAIDSPFVNFDCHLVTIGQKPYTLARRHRIEYNLPARLEDIPGKNGSVYQVLISPRRPVVIDTISCPYNPTVAGQFITNPSANFDFYFIEGALADFNWKQTRDYLEAEYVRFRNALDITAPGKVTYYLCPCPVRTVHWDDRFGYAIDPGRASIYTLYGHKFISCDAILTNMMKLLRLWGYSPPLIVEGLAGYFEFTPYETKILAQEGRLPDLHDLLTTAGYYATDPQAAELAAASFIRFLADSHGINKVRQWYEQADDLTIARSFTTIFEMSLDSVQSEWREYVDTISVTRDMFDFYAARAGALLRRSTQQHYLEKMQAYDSDRSDSVSTWTKLSPLYYQSGDYYRAIEGYQLLVATDTSRPMYFQILGNLNMANGNYDAALAAFDSAYALDTTFVSAPLMKARTLAIQGDTTGALAMTRLYFGRETSIAEKAVFLLQLGELTGAGGPGHDSAAADNYYADALYWTNKIIEQSQPDPVHYLRGGIAALGLRDYPQAQTFLETAHFIETRALLLGEVLLRLGQLHDALGDREQALTYYREALNSQIAAYQRDLCIHYIDHPYRN